jgi:hypothetical protein
MIGFIIAYRKKEDKHNSGRKTGAARQTQASPRANRGFKKDFLINFVFKIPRRAGCSPCSPAPPLFFGRNCACLLFSGML